MAGEVITIHAGQQPPGSWDASMFVGGSAQGAGSAGACWEAEFIAVLRDQWKTDGLLVVFVTDESDCEGGDVDTGVISWYDHALNVADVAVFWWPDDGGARFMATTLAMQVDSQQVVHGAPLRAMHARQLLEYSIGHAMSTGTTLADMANAALDLIGSGARRRGGEREVPLHVWRTDSFRRWHSAQNSAGNTLLGARQVWTFSAGSDGRFLLYWALHVRVHVRAEQRIKCNEVVISRPDISVLALYQDGVTIDDTVVVLVREFRSPASTPDGFVHELPGGSGAAEIDALSQAVRETEEETGLAIDVRRIRAYGSRQLAATMSAHHAHLFAVEISSDEIAQLRAARSAPRGSGTEQTWPEIATFGDIRRKRLVDWATLGMIAEVVLHDQSSR